MLFRSTSRDPRRNREQLTIHPSARGSRVPPLARLSKVRRQNFLRPGSHREPSRIQRVLHPRRASAAPTRDPSSISAHPTVSPAAHLPNTPSPVLPPSSPTASELPSTRILYSTPSHPVAAIGKAVKIPIAALHSSAAPPSVPKNKHARSREANHHLSRALWTWES